MDLLDVDIESHRLVLNLLPPKDLACVAASCRYFYRAVYDGYFAECLWKQWCIDLLGPGVVALHEAALPAGYRAGAIFWRDLYLAGNSLDKVRWWRHGAQELKSSVDVVDAAEAAATKANVEEEAARLAADNADGLGEERRSAVLAEAEAAAAQGGKTLKSKLARSGHTATLLGTRVLITGGILRDGSLYVDIVIVDLSTLKVSRPEMSGTAPSTRFRHTISPISPSPGSSLEVQVIDALGSVKRVEDGDLLFCFGGYNTIGEEFGANSQFVLWAARDGSQYVWIPVKMSGDPPSPRFHHSSDSFDGGRKVVIFGGEGYRLDDAGEGPSPCVYILDVDSLTWHRCITHSPVEAHSPGARSLHVTTVRRSPVSGREELVVVGGYCASLLAEMKPFTLDLETLYWRCWPGVAGDNPPSLPTPRQRMAAMCITSDWFLISGGSPTSGSFLEDVQRLHIPSLVWGSTPAVSGRPSRALRRIAGHTFAGLLAFGGCIPTIMGIMPVEKLDLLLLGNGATGLIPVEEGKGKGVQAARVGSAAEAAQQGEKGIVPAAAQGVVSDVQLQESLSRILAGKQAVDPGSEPDSPVMTSEEASAKARSGDMALEEALQEGVFNELMQDQLLNKGQRINIGSPDTYFRPVYATAAGVKSAAPTEQQAFVPGRLQVISTSVLNDPEHMRQMDRQFHNELPAPQEGDLSAAAAAAAELVAAAAAAGKAAERPPLSGTVQRAASGPPDDKTAASASAAVSSVTGRDNSMIAILHEADSKGPNPFQGLADATSSKLSTIAETDRPDGQAASAPLQKGAGFGLPDTLGLSETGKRLLIEEEKRRPTAAEKGKAKAIDYDEIFLRGAVPILAAMRPDEAGPSNVQVAMAMQASSMQMHPADPKQLDPLSMVPKQESSSEEDIAAGALGSPGGMSIYVWQKEEPQPSLLPPAEGTAARPAGALVNFWYNAIDAAALSAASTGEVETQVRTTTEAEGGKAPLTSAHLPMQGGSHAIYAISSVRNEESLVIDGPNPFGEVRDAPWGPVLADGDVQPVLLPADAELDPVAVARLKLGADLTLEQLQEMQVAGDDEAPQPSGTSPVEALIPDVHPDPWSLPGAADTAGSQGILRRRPGPPGLTEHLQSIAQLVAQPIAQQGDANEPSLGGSTPLRPCSTETRDRAGSLSIGTAEKKSTRQSGVQTTANTAWGTGARSAAEWQQPVAPLVVQSTPSTDAAVAVQSPPALTADPSGPKRIQLWRDMATGQLYRLPEPDSTGHNSLTSASSAQPAAADRPTSGSGSSTANRSDSHSSRALCTIQ